MYIIDNKGNSMEVTDLDKAIAQARTFKRYRHSDPIVAEADKERQRYWKDAYIKLLLETPGINPVQFPDQ